MVDAMQSTTPRTAAERVTAAKQRTENLTPDQVAAELGYTRIAHLDGGFKAWTASGREVVGA
jgi:hypothetical protein